MNRKPGRAQSVSLWCAVMLCCSALVAHTGALDKKGPSIVLHVEGGVVSADIRAMPLVEVIHELEVQTGVTIRLSPPYGQEQVITVRVEKRTLIAALRAILKHTNYAIVIGSTEQGGGIQVYIYPHLPENASFPSPVDSAPEVGGQASDLTPQSSGPRPETPMEPPVLPAIVGPESVVRVQELKSLVASYGLQSLDEILTGAHDANSWVRSASEQLLVDDLRPVVPRETLTRIALTSERAKLRMKALEALAERQDQAYYSRMTLEEALHDLEPAVRQRAAALLRELAASEPELAPSQSRAQPDARRPR